ncbi:alkaline phosphatase [uncultured Desulfuromonas sp.]|uniref:alkaline phosphatase n=1 Tax=uncultured Desulfuromonas sp. TaxID=181013 RepID=UPI002AABD0C3|nr:alkaline phosphatase [uncultured Desulfuromonas sp.]
MKLTSIKRMLVASAAVCTLCLAGTAVAGTTSYNGSAPKYIFYFIGDGMASPQIHATEAYLAAVQDDDIVAGGIKAEKLTMSQFPVMGMQMSYANNRFITGSAAAGTALACGMKTNIGVISMNPDAVLKYKTLAEVAKERGMKVGIISSVSIDHATPAVFYSHTESRNNYEEIGAQLLDSGFDYFAGGGFRVNKYTSSEYASLDNDARYARVESKAAAKGFTFANTRDEFDALSGGRAIAVNPYLDSSNAIPYALNRINNEADYEGSITLAEFTAKGIDLLYTKNDGFFMMVEGGKIDWAAHANDARAAIEDTIAFDNAIAEAVAFATEHPKETLIVVTGDHECGGMTLGYAGTVYETYYEKMAAQTIAYDDFDSKVIGAYKANYTTLPSDVDTTMWQLILDFYGLDGAALTADEGDDLTEYEISLVEDAFDMTMRGESVNTSEEDSLLYGGYNALSVTLTHLLNRKSGLAWTSYSHTAVPVPVMASGAGEDMFDGYYDNTDVAKKIAEIMKVYLNSL